MIKTQTFKGKYFQIIKGNTHPDYSFDTFEREEYEFRNKYWNIKEGDVVLDIGASYGSYSLTACAMGATVYSFEPEKTVFVDLIKNININEWQNKCIPFNIGLWSSPSNIDMKSYAPHWPAYTISDIFKMDTIDNIISSNNISKIDWIKMDIEGAEEHAIRGALNTIKKFHPKFIIECHIFLDPNILQNVQSLIASSYNYTFIELDRPPCKMLLAYPIL
jgi:FkbM family methyltransferase